MGESSRAAIGGKAGKSIVRGRRFWLIAAIVVLLDQAAKQAAEVWLAPLGSILVIPGLLAFSHVHNTGAAFGQFSGGGRALSLVGVAAVAGILLLRRRLLGQGNRSRSLWIGLAMALGGATGNLIDRLRLGYVIDFLDISPLFRFPVFNVADTALTLSALSLAVHLLRTPRTERPADDSGSEPCSEPCNDAIAAEREPGC